MMPGSISGLFFVFKNIIDLWVLLKIRILVRGQGMRKF